MKPLTYSPNRWVEFLRLTDPELLKACKVDVHKSSGKGGQKKNKVENAIRLTLNKLQVVESSSRSKETNIKGALTKMRIAIALDYLVGNEFRTFMTDPPKEIMPYLGSGEIRISQKNPAFPLFLGWFLDRFLAHQSDFSALAIEVGSSKTQVRKFIERNPALNHVVAEAGEFVFMMNSLISGPKE